MKEKDKYSIFDQLRSIVEEKESIPPMGGVGAVCARAFAPGEGRRECVPKKGGMNLQSLQRGWMRTYVYLLWERSAHNQSTRTHARTLERKEAIRYTENERVRGSRAQPQKRISMSSHWAAEAS